MVKFEKTGVFWQVVDPWGQGGPGGAGYHVHNVEWRSGARKRETPGFDSLSLFIRRRLQTETLILPRPARDKHKEHSKKRSGSMCRDLERRREQLQRGTDRRVRLRLVVCRALDHNDGEQRERQAPHVGQHRHRRHARRRFRWGQRERRGRNSHVHLPAA